MKNRYPFSIIQIVGYKNSGKTTLVNKLVRTLTEQNKKVGTLKHHGHGGKPLVIKGTDSQQHVEAGSIMSGVEGDGTFQLTIQQNTGLSLDQLIDYYQYFPLDYLIVEGYKNVGLPKVILIRRRDDLQQLLHNLTNIRAVITWDDQGIQGLDLPTFFIEDDLRYIPWILHEGRKGEA
ncbi:molybdopterin-guanine dinucleotide biosynthesis protein B [Aquibacillus sp. 3ASR75-11]|uniref:Molybdopterin-guanine dinucleotide biosynthesis protein B n=1 Tax=Terrihalobacillus insolitus TaxID=2950438 RepID=A0A9X3WVG6_9BACI|nr:molybdopterin-guanine dinucleotide biosynthesis protein B [Terrihalobacillus insolitus]MDC3413704.1 molybdopterin-guanine dinucleotide biosynthesis protein B [Terrihalobacillus insolitus]MDC3425563.1 molybdopterin-guanine dinucleotide biosynthesis protein B [Terrihalobacillus insolitus]